MKLILKGSSEQDKKKILAAGHLAPEQGEFYVNALKKFDSVEMADYEKV